jgi:hypothetical protein
VRSCTPAGTTLTTIGITRRHKVNAPSGGFGGGGPFGGSPHPTRMRCSAGACRVALDDSRRPVLLAQLVADIALAYCDLERSKDPCNTRDC